MAPSGSEWRQVEPHFCDSKILNHIGRLGAEWNISYNVYVPQNSSENLEKILQMAT